jgi:hypothetical protein
MTEEWKIGKRLQRAKALKTVSIPYRSVHHSVIPFFHSSVFGFSSRIRLKEPDLFSSFSLLEGLPFVLEFSLQKDLVI